MDPKLFAKAIVSIERKYGLRLDVQDVWMRLDATPCGRGWVGTKPGCKRANKTGGSPVKPKPAKEEKKATGLPCGKGWEGTKPGCKRISKNRKAETSKPAPAKGKDKIEPKKTQPTSVIEVNSNATTDNPGILPYKKVKRLGKGAFGTVILTDRGTVIKLADGAMSAKLSAAQNEFEGLKQFEKLGIGPKAIGIDGKTIEMEMIKGKTLFDLKKEGASPEEHQANQMKVAKALLKLHKSGWVHGDAHHKNLLIDSEGNAKIIDAGYAEKVPGRFSSTSGYTDIVRALEKHPALPAFEAEMKPFVTAYRRESMEATNLRVPLKDVDQRAKNSGVPLKKLHDAYLGIADKFIK